MVPVAAECGCASECEHSQRSNLEDRPCVYPRVMPWEEWVIGGTRGVPPVTGGSMGSECV